MQTPEHRSASEIRVLCVDDHRVVLEGLCLVIGRHPDLVVIGAASSGEESLELFKRHHPDVTLMDLQLGPAMSGLQAIREIRRHDSEARIIVLTMYQGDEDIFRALEAGASTYLLKHALSEDLVRVVRQVHAGERPLIPVVEARLAERAASSRVTDREVQILELMSRGLRNKEIAASLGIREETVHVHIRHIFIKLKVSDRNGAVNVALRRGIIHVA